MYKLEKLQLEDGKDSMLPTGYSQTGDSLLLFLAGTEERKKISNIHQVEAGWQLLLTSGTHFLNTSPIQQILDMGDDYIKFRTMTSIYLLTNEEDR